MAYTIYNNDGTVLSTIAVGAVDTYSTSLDLIGKNVNDYGEYYNRNLVRLLTSFASEETEQPRTPQPGQLWFNKSTKRLTVYDGSSFQPTYGSHVSGTAPITTSTGDFWYDSVNTQLKIWDGDSYNLIGPATSGLLGSFGILPAIIPIRDDGSKLAQKVSVVHSYGNYIGLLSTSSFTMEANSSTVFLAGTAFAGITQNVVNGVSIFRDLQVFGNTVLRGNVEIAGTTNITTDSIVGPKKDLSAYYNITPYSSYTATTTTSTFTTTGVTNEINYYTANRSIAADLVKMFSTATYETGSIVSVLCVYNTTTSVRKFELKSLFPPVKWWEPKNDYAYTWTATFTATNLSSVPWLWSTSTNTNIVL